MKGKEILRKNKIWIFTLIGIVLVCVLAGVFLKTRSISMGADPLKTGDVMHSQIYVTGEGYALNYEQEQQCLQEQKELEQQIQQQKDQKPEKEDFSQAKATKAPGNQVITDTGNATDVIAYENAGTTAGNGSGGQGEGTGGTTVDPSNPGTGENGTTGGNGSGSITPGGTTTPSNPTQPDPSNPDPGKDPSKNPTITTDLSDGQQISGSSVSMHVLATDYKKNTLSAFYIDVYVNGQKVTSSGKEVAGVLYRIRDLKDGANQISITARDKENNETSISLTVYADTSIPTPLGGSVTLTIDASVLGLGTLTTVTAEFYQGESMADIVDRECKRAGYQVSSDQSPTTGYYLKRLSKQGLTDGITFSQEIQDQYGLINDPSTWSYTKDSLGEKDFTRYSGWLYSVNGSYLDGMSSVLAADGDEIILEYTLDLK